MALLKLDDWLAPWEVKDGQPVPEEEQVIDKSALRKYLHGLLGDKERLQTAVATVTAERDGFKAQVDEKQREGENEVDRLKRELAEAQQKIESGDTPAVKKLKIAVAAGLEPDDVDLIRGNDEASWKENADKLAERFGVKKGDSSENPGGEGEVSPSTQPRELRNPGDRQGDKGESRVNYDSELDRISRGGGAF